jgi:hypothetical protein
VRILVRRKAILRNKKRVFQYQWFRKTSCNRILERFLRTNDSRERLSVLKFPFHAVTPTLQAEWG